MQYSRLQNAQQFDDLVKQIVDPANDSASAQKDLWNKITLAASVAQQNPASAGGTQSAGTTTTPGSQQSATSGDDPELLKPQVEQAIDKLTPSGTRDALGKVLRQGFTQNNATLKSTGEPGIDAFLMSLKFNVQ
jgi:hypothetical protein